MKYTFEDIVMETYRLMFAAAEPPADFDDLMANSPRNDNGQIEIPFMSHRIKSEDYERIMNNQIKKHKIKGYKKKSFAISIALGCSPAFAKDTE